MVGRMRLAYVRLDVALKIPGAKDARYEIDDEMAPSMRYDQATNSLVIGDIGLTWGHVIEWRRLNIEVVCEKCGQDFKNEAGRGKHMLSCKGKKEP